MTTAQLDWRREWRPLAFLAAAFLAAFYMPVGIPRFDNALREALELVRWYAREHVILCLIPAFFIAGAISVFVSQASVMRYLGAGANQVMAYAVASVSGSVLAVCSCTVLPLFAGIYKMGAGLGPAAAFLYAGPAVNVLAIILTARILGLDLGVARAVGAVVFSVVIGLLMHVIFRREEQSRVAAQAALPPGPAPRPLGQTASHLALLVAVLIFATWSRSDAQSGLYPVIFTLKWPLTALAAAGLAAILVAWFRLRWWQPVVLGGAVAVLVVLVPAGRPLLPFGAAVVGFSVIATRDKGELGAWFAASWSFAKQIMPLLLGGVFVSGFLLGRPGQEGVIPSAWVAGAVGGNSLGANLFASVVGAFMYFATLTEVPILQGLLGAGMGKGPALALLLAGPALSLPSMLVIRTVLGTQRTAVYIGLVVVMATVSGMIFGMIAS